MNHNAPVPQKRQILAGPKSLSNQTRLRDFHGWKLKASVSGDSSPPCSLFTSAAAIRGTEPYCFVCHKLFKAKKSDYLNSPGEEAQEKPPGS